MARKRKKRWIKGAVKKPGSFTRQAKRAGMGVQPFAKKVIAGKPTKRTPTGRYTSRTKKRARFATTMKCDGK